MDILKVLSRGTKKTQRNSQNSSNAQQKLPSAGTSTNPQLYHDQVRGQKRKRTKNEPEPEAHDELPEVDFFAPKPEPVAKAAVETEEPVQVPKPTRPSRLLSEDECRQLLRSHRLKITLLSKSEDQSKVKKSKKKKKAAVEVKKDGKKQLFPQPLDSFSELRNAYGLSNKVADNLVFQGYRVSY